jgi:predicted nucleic acid-binding Zn ribbon protein
MKSAAELLPGVYRRLAGRAADEEALLLSLWPVVVGEKVAAQTRPVRLFGATLIVEAASQEWRRQLAWMAGQIIPRLNGAAGKPVVKDVEFRVAGQQAPRPPQRAATATGFQPDEAAAIADPHLRRLYRLSRKRAQAR